MKHFEEKDIPLVQQYLAGGLSGEKKKDFEQRLADPRLQNELEMYKAFFSALEESEDHRRKALLQALGRKPAFLNRFQPWAIAAGFLLVAVLGAAIWAQFRQDSLFVPYGLIIDNPNRSEAARSAYGYYQEGKYKEALPFFESANDSTTHFLFFRANCLMALNKDKDAIPHLHRVEEDVESVLAVHAKWYLALAYYRIGNKAQAQEFARMTLNDPSAMEENKNKARKLLDDLE